MYLAVAGNIGVGKSSLTKLLSERYALTPVYEAVDENPYLEDFYSDMAAYAFHSQVFFLSKRLEQHLSHINRAERVIQDRTIYEDAHIFARNLFDQGLLSPRDYETYRGLYKATLLALRPPDLLLYLRADVATLQRRIRQRGRAFEQAIEASYLRRLNVLYETFVATFDLSSVLVIDTNGLDFVGNPADFERLCRQLERSGLSQPML